MSGSDKITAGHRRRDARVYVRQSTPTQMVDHTESLQRQYELIERAQTLGWAAGQVTVIDEDLGRSGADATARVGFQQLVADVGLGRVGLVVGIEVSRLARNNADWYHLLDLCALTDTLIADSDGVYHPGDYNDRLVLGLKGTMSEAELHLIRARLTAGLRHKAAKGELRQHLPVGFDYDEHGHVTVTADEAVVAAISEVFRRFDEHGSARQVLLSLRADGLALPRRPVRTGKVSWQPATYPAVHDFLTNPCYAGAFVFGRTRTDKHLDEQGRLVTRTRQVPRDEWAVLICDHHPGFVAWDRYEEIQAQLRANWRAPRGQGGGAPREGRALLQGLVRCGQCGRKMQVGYSGTTGDCPRYACARAKQLYGGARTCQSLGGRRLEQRVCDQLFAALEPAAMAATADALAQAEARHAERLRAFELAVERARYEADRARRQFEAVEPENRLVARTLEAGWEQALAAVRTAEADLTAQQARRPTRLSADELAWVHHAGADIRAIFDAPTTSPRDRKQLLRAVIDEVAVTVQAADRTADVTIVWQGGATTAFTMPLNRTGGHYRTHDTDTVALVRQLAACYDDETIAHILGRQHRHTATGLPFTKARVRSLRASYDIPAFDPASQPPADDDATVCTADEAAAELGVDKTTIYRWLRTGFLAGDQLTHGAPWRIRIDQTVRDRIVPHAPDGWLPLEEAAAALGVARQTVLHKVQRGELYAVHLNRGRRKGLRINVHPHQDGLFAHLE